METYRLLISENNTTLYFGVDEELFLSIDFIRNPFNQIKNSRHEHDEKANSVQSCINTTNTYHSINKRC